LHAQSHATPSEALCDPELLMNVSGQHGKLEKPRRDGALVVLVLLPKGLRNLARLRGDPMAVDVKEWSVRSSCRIAVRGRIVLRFRYRRPHNDRGRPGPLLFVGFPHLHPSEIPLKLEAGKPFDEPRQIFGGQNATRLVSSRIGWRSQLRPQTIAERRTLHLRDPV
jgi:hypothetical protein